jgi:hypothetical protein
LYTYKVFGHPSVSKVKVAAYLRKWLKLGLQEAMDFAKELAQRPVEVLLKGQPLEGWEAKPPMLPDDKPPFSIISERYDDLDDPYNVPPGVVLPGVPVRRVLPTLIAAPLTSIQPMSFPSGTTFLESSHVVASATPVKALESEFTTCQTCVSFGHASNTCWRTPHGEPREPTDRCDHWNLNPDYMGEPP